MIDRPVARFSVILQSLFSCLFLVLFATGCATQNTVKKTVLFWPPPPDKPRIEFQYNIKELKDIGYKKSFFRIAAEFIVGKTITPKIIRPIGLHIDKSLLFVTDTGLQAVHVYDLEKKKYYQLFKTADNRLRSPVGVTTDKNGIIYVTDSILNKIVVYSADFKYMTEMENEEFVRISGIAYNKEDDLLYVVDSGAHMVHRLDLEGRKVSSVGARGNGYDGFNYPTHITFNPEGNLLVSDSLNFRVAVVTVNDSGGKIINSIGHLGSRLGSFSKPKGVATDIQSNVYVVDGLYDVVQIFNKGGELLMSFGISGSKDGEFWLPAGISIDDKNNIYIADTYNQRVSVFKIVDLAD